MTARKLVRTILDIGEFGNVIGFEMLDATEKTGVDMKTQNFFRFENKDPPIIKYDEEYDILTGWIEKSRSVDQVSADIRVFLDGGNLLSLELPFRLSDFDAGLGY